MSVRRIRPHKFQRSPWGNNFDARPHLAHLQQDLTFVWTRSMILMNYPLKIPLLLRKNSKNLDEADETFATYQDRLSVVWKEKNKEVLAAKEEELQNGSKKRFRKELSLLALKAFKEEVSVADVSEEENQEVVVEEIPVSEISEDALVNAEAETTDSISNNNGASSEQERTLRDKFKQAFHKENITIKY